MMIDRTTHWPEAVPIADTTAETVLQAFLDNWVSRFGIPVTVTSDRGAQFTSEVWRKALTQLGINISATKSYHLQANGIVEHFHWTLKNVLRCAIRSSKSWTRSLHWAMLGLRNAPKIDTTISTVEVVFRAPQRVPSLCFQAEQSRPRSAAEQLVLATASVAAFSPDSLDLRRFKSSPFFSVRRSTSS